MSGSPEPLLPPGWDFAPGAWPARSVLRGHAPEAIGTGMVASLAGHLIDLSWAHGIPPVELLRWVADEGSLPGVPGRTRADFEAMNLNILRKPRASLVGPSKTSEVMVEALGRLTCRDDIVATTLLAWAPVLPSKNAFRATRAYCPCCHEEWARPAVPGDGTPSAGRPRGVYEPLLWQFSTLEACIRHGVRLRTACPNPECRVARGVLGAWARPGYCSRCGSFLGRTLGDVIAAEGVLDADTLDWQRYVTQALSDLITDPPAAGEAISSLATPRAVQLAVERATDGTYTPFAEAIRMSLGTVSLWKDGRRRPTIDGALRICAVAGFRLPDFLAGRLTALEATTPPAKVPYVPPSGETHQVHDRGAMQARLRLALRESPPPALTSVERDLHIDRRQLARLYPDDCRRIRDRHLEWIEDRSLAAQRECQELVVAAMATVHAQGRYPSRHQVQMLLPSWVSLRGPILERLWKDEVVRLGYPRPDKPRRRTPVG